MPCPAIWSATTCWRRSTHPAGPGGDDREGGIQWDRRPDAVDLFLAEASQRERGLAQRLGGGAPRGGHGAARPVPLDDDHSATEVDRQFGGGLAGWAGADHRQIVACFHSRCPSRDARLRWPTRLWESGRSVMAPPRRGRWTGGSLPRRACSTIALRCGTWRPTRLLASHPDRQRETDAVARHGAPRLQMVQH